MIFYGVARSRTRLSDFPFTFHFHALEKEMATHSSVLAWRIPGMGEPGGLPSMGLHRVRHDWSDLAVPTPLTPLLATLDWKYAVLLSQKVKIQCLIYVYTYSSYCKNRMTCISTLDGLSFSTDISVIFCWLMEIVLEFKTRRCVYVHIRMCFQII